MNTIATVIIAYNEKQMLEITLPPVKEVSDQVIVVDMGSTDGSHEIYDKVLGEKDLVAPYSRRNLFDFGFSHVRNYGAKMAKADWIFVVDSDEYIDAEATREAFSMLPEIKELAAKVNRLNFTKTEGFTVDSLPDLLANCPFTVESHRRLFRNLPRVRFEGMIHEELWVDETNAYYCSAETPIVLNHLNQFKANGNEHLKFGLYSYLTLKGVLYPNMRYGTNEWWFTRFPQERWKNIVETVQDFTECENLPPVDFDAVKAQLAVEGIKLPDEDIA